VMSRWHYW